MDNYIVPIRRFGKATHVVLGIIADLNEPEVVHYLPLESECSLTNFDTEFMKEIIYCDESDWHRLVEQNSYKDNEHDDYYYNSTYFVYQYHPGGIPEYSDFKKK